MTLLEQFRMLPMGSKIVVGFMFSIVGALFFFAVYLFSMKWIQNQRHSNFNLRRNLIWSYRFLDFQHRLIHILHGSRFLQCFMRPPSSHCISMKSTQTSGGNKVSSHVCRRKWTVSIFRHYHDPWRIGSELFNVLGLRCLFSPTSLLTSQTSVLRNTISTKRGCKSTGEKSCHHDKSFL